MTVELDVLRHVTGALERAGLAYMVTGSMALAHYATPRMTRDIDIVVLLTERDATRLQKTLGADFYLDPEAMRQAIQHERLFNMMHMATAIKVDLVVRKSSEYRRVEFERRRRVDFGGAPLWIVSREDLILSKLDWARDSGSELQQRDVRTLLAGPVDSDYLQHWARVLGLESHLKRLQP